MRFGRKENFEIDNEKKYWHFRKYGIIISIQFHLPSLSKKKSIPVIYNSIKISRIFFEVIRCDICRNLTNWIFLIDKWTMPNVNQTISFLGKSILPMKLIGSDDLLKTMIGGKYRKKKSMYFSFMNLIILFDVE